MNRPDIEDILKAACEVCNVDAEFIQRKTTKRDSVIIRQIVQYLATRLTKHNLRNIAREVGNKKQHGTVIWAAKRVSYDYEHYDDTRIIVDRILENLQSKGFSLKTNDQIALEEIEEWRRLKWQTGIDLQELG